MWHRLARSARPHAWPAVTGLVLGLLALGPALGPGFVLSYDMVFVPRPPIGSADIGAAGGPPRAVPSDLIVALAARVIPAELVQKVILLGVFVLACSGTAALLRCRAGGDLPAAGRAGTPQTGTARTGTARTGTGQTALLRPPASAPGGLPPAIRQADEQSARLRASCQPLAATVIAGPHAALDRKVRNKSNMRNP